jgi:hypothetical protein
VELDELTEHPYEVVDAGESLGATGALDGVPGGKFGPIAPGAERMSAPVITGPWCGQNRKTPGQIIPLLTPIDYCVNHAVSVKKLGSMGSLWKLLTDDLLRYTGPREADQGARFRENDIAQVRE